MMDILYS